ncbi:MAG: aminopeptidase P family protein [SAR324 cluster bacterium]|nr:aminopeptidase P family protein [SAR324 cluster bacterium]
MTEDSVLLEQKLSKILMRLEQHEVDVYLVPSVDEHLNEMVPEYKQRLKAITGFTGSAGTALICRTGTHQLFVDSRYHLQAAQEVPGSLFEIQKLGALGVLSVEEWLTEKESNKGALKVGFDPFTMSPKTYRAFKKCLKDKASQLTPMTPNLIDQVWEERPQARCQPFYLLEDSWTGESVEMKLNRVREKMRENGVQALVLSKLDEIAWITNLRGSDIARNPVFEAYCVIEQEQATCFSLAEPPELVRAHLKELIQFKPYSVYQNTLQSLSNFKIWLDPASTTMGTYLSLQKSKSPEEVAAYQFEKTNPIVLFKALKNPVEIRQIRKAHHQSACAKVRSFVRLFEQLERGEPISEKGYAEILSEEYRREEGFVDLSFDTIAGFAENGAIVHYSDPSPEKKLEPGHMLLVDSGIQIAGGTTDDTRTLAIGEPTEKHKRLYTKVLQSHIRLAMQKFPEGTKGSALDAVARSSLWNSGLDYGHGTGHGVGAFLNVHEGPHSISPLSHGMDLRPGMIVSNEPGYYETDWGGIRLENLYVVVPLENMPAHPGGKKWLHFESLTWIPFDRHLIDPEHLQSDELQWLNEYHLQVWQEISSSLKGPEQEWLKQACSAISG